MANIGWIPARRKSGMRPVAGWGGIAAAAGVAYVSRAQNASRTTNEMSVPIPLIPPGARVKVRRSTLPIDPLYLGWTGTVVTSTEYEPSRVDVALDGTGEIRQFSPMELERVDRPAIEADRAAAGRRLARP